MEGLVRTTSLCACVYVSCMYQKCCECETVRGVKRAIEGGFVDPCSGQEGCSGEKVAAPSAADQSPFALRN